VKGIQSNVGEERCSTMSSPQLSDHCLGDAGVLQPDASEPAEGDVDDDLLLPAVRLASLPADPGASPNVSEPEDGGLRPDQLLASSTACLLACCPWGISRTHPCITTCDFATLLYVCAKTL
jgi:hypothetical protein